MEACEGRNELIFKNEKLSVPYFWKNAHLHLSRMWSLGMKVVRTCAYVVCVRVPVCVYMGVCGVCVYMLMYPDLCMLECVQCTCVKHVPALVEVRD